MPLTDKGRDLIAALLAGEAVNSLDNANAAIGVGDGTAAYDEAQTDLQGTSKVRKGMISGFPQRSANVLTLRASFAQGEGNFDWQEWGVFNALSAGDMVSRKVESLGTKDSSKVWEFEVDLTIVNNDATP